MIAVLALCLSPVVLADDSDAETVDYGELYCYGDNPIIMQLFPETKSTWSVTSNGKEVPFDDNGDGSITIRLAGVDGKVTVTATVTVTTTTILRVPMTKIALPLYMFYRHAQTLPTATSRGCPEVRLGLAKRC